jgi:hypothetical protein
MSQDCCLVSCHVPERFNCLGKQNSGSVGLYRFVPFDGWHNDEHKLSWFETYMKLLMAPFLVSGMAGMRKLSILDDRCL